MLTANLRAHPKVLEVRWQIYANLVKWAGALDGPDLEWLRGELKN